MTTAGKLSLWLAAFACACLLAGPGGRAAAQDVPDASDAAPASSPSAAAAGDRIELPSGPIPPATADTGDFLRLPGGAVLTSQPRILVQIPNEPAPPRNRGLTVIDPVVSTGPDEPSRAVLGSDAVWRDPVIPVCWERMDANFANGRAWTQAAVEASWEKVSNVDFTGWGACAETSRGVRIRVAEAGPSVAELGRALDGMPGGMTLNFTFRSWGTGCSRSDEVRKYCIRALAVHEFGHALGLAHEHNRGDRPLCQAERQGPLPAFFMTAYDASSVMNYCAENWNNNGNLSALDVLGIRTVYGPFDAEIPAIVEVAAAAEFGNVTANGQRFEFITLALTEQDPVQRSSVWLCDPGKGLVNLVVEARLVPGKHELDVTSTASARTITDGACAPGGTLASGTARETIYEPVAVARPRDIPLAGLSYPVSLDVAARRVVGATQDVAACTGCAVAAQEAVFLDGPVPDIEEAGLGGQPAQPATVEPLAPVPGLQPVSDREIVQSSVQALVLGTNAVWRDPDIPVCWESPASGADEAIAREWTRSAVRASWEKVSNVSFEGWGVCATDAGGIRIRTADTGPHVAELGSALDGVPGGMVLNFAFGAWGRDCQAHRQFCIRALAVHEFGHALGMAHEHNRDDRDASLCQAEPQGPLPAFIMTAYDPNSVMNYCAPSWNNNGRLSPLDVAGVRMVYGPYSEEIPALAAVSGTVAFAMPGEREDQTFEAVFALAGSEAEQAELIELCNGDDLVVAVRLTASLAPGASAVSFEAEGELFEASGCERGTRLAAFERHAALAEPGGSEFTAPVSFGEMTATGYVPLADISLSPSRGIGEAADAEACSGCAAAASEAVFTTGPPPPLPGFGIGGHAGDVAVREARSPWPDEFEVDFEACERAVTAGPDYGGAAWPDTAIRTLCDGAPASTEPAACYAQIMTSGLQWGNGTRWVASNAVNLCQGAFDAGGRIACFSDRLRSGLAWPGAIEACKSL